MTNNTPLPEDQAEMETQISADGTPSPLPEVLPVNNSMVGSVNASQDAEVNNSMVGALAVGRDSSVTNSFSSVVAVGRDLHFKDGCGLMLTVGNQAQVESSKIGVLLAKSDVTLTDSKILMTTQQAIAFGAAFGAVFALCSTLLRRKKSA